MKILLTGLTYPTVAKINHPLVLYIIIIFIFSLNTVIKQVVEIRLFVFFEKYLLRVLFFHFFPALIISLLLCIFAMHDKALSCTSDKCWQVRILRSPLPPPLSGDVKMDIKMNKYHRTPTGIDVSANTQRVSQMFSGTRCLQCSQSQLRDPKAGKVPSSFSSLE
jgi:hypothetical protein